MHDDDRAFRDARDAVEFSLGSAFAGIEDAREGLDRLATLVGDRSEVDGLRGAIALVAYAVEGLAVAMGQLESGGSRRR